MRGRHHPSVPQHPVQGAGHGLSNGDLVHITGIGRKTQINPATHQIWVVSNSTDNPYTLNSSVGPNDTARTTGSHSSCTKPGCQFYRFTNVSSSPRLHPMTSCAAQRKGSQAYTDVAASTAYVGRPYRARLGLLPPVAEVWSDLSRGKPAGKLWSAETAQVCCLNHRR